MARIGAPILRTLNGTALFEGGTFAWINPRTAVAARTVRVNEEGVRQVEEVLRAQGVELLRVDMPGYEMHIDGAFVMVDRDLGYLSAGPTRIDRNKTVHFAVQFDIL